MSFIITDNPIEDYGTGDSLEFKRLAKHFTNMCSSKDTRTPFAIAINGKWGSGKTSMMKIIKNMLDDERNQVKEKKRPCYTFWFNAWKYQTVDHMLVALLLVMFKELEKEATFWDQFCTQIDKLNFMAGIVDKVYSKISDAKTKNFIRQLRVMEKAAVMDDFSQMMEIMVNNYCVSGGDAAAKKIFHAELKKGLCEKAFVFFIDDLDRCQSDRIVQVFESIKLFMGEFPGCIFFLGMDNNQIKKAILNAYSQKDGAGFNAAEYLSV